MDELDKVVTEELDAMGIMEDEELTEIDEDTDETDDVEEVEDGGEKSPSAKKGKGTGTQKTKNGKAASFVPQFKRQNAMAPPEVKKRKRNDSEVNT